MDLQHLIHNFFSPPVPFFFVGLLAVIFKSDLEIPGEVSKFISLYLLMAIGFKGGVELYESGLTTEVVLVIISALLLSIIIPIYSFFILRKRLDVPNSAALAAAFGSVSAVTFITATNILSIAQAEINVLHPLDTSMKAGGHMVAAMALMESPSIIIGVLLYRKFSGQKDGHHLEMKELLREAFLNGSIVVLLGSLLIGLVSHEHGAKIMEPFTGGIFKGMLSFFLLDMGVVAGKRISALKEAGWFLIGFGVLMPLLNAAVGIGISLLIGLDQPNSFMFTVLCASASYIAVPAAMRIAIPDANPGIYVPVALAITFPFNIIAGLPLYYWILERIHGV
ncbi:MAG: sodium-dependent bicarbonate transport family permease [Bacteroidia bacterium]|nr:sodium-dependent bicarbonate transport family permease [Bacteroidia bacterium]